MQQDGTQLSPLRSRVAIGALGVAVVLVLCALEHAAGASAFLTTVYLVPVAVVSWFAGMEVAVVVAGIATVAAAAASPRAGLVSTVVMPAMLNGVIVWAVGTLQIALARERRLARTDVVTGVPNRRAFEEQARAMLRRHARLGRPITAVGLDLDGFKAVNDELGHGEGDAVLREVASTLARVVRSSDTLCRYGGDEFAVIFAETDEKGAATLLARLRDALDASMRANGWPVTFSIGAITFRRAPMEGELMRLVDEQIYAAKRAGKDRVVHEVQAI